MLGFLFVTGHGRIWGTQGAVIVLGLLLALVVFKSGRALVADLADTQTELLPQSQYLMVLQSQVVRHERLLYACFVNNDVEGIFDAMYSLQAEIRQAMDKLVPLPGQEAQLKDLQNLLADIFLLGDQLSREMQNPGSTENTAEDILGQITAYGKALDAKSVDLFGGIKDNIGAQMADTRQQTWRLVVWVLVFSLAIAFSFILSAYFIRRYQQESGANRLLFAFPQQNPHPVMSFSNQGEAIYCNPATFHFTHQLLGPRVQETELLPKDYQRRLVDMYREERSEEVWLHTVADRLLQCRVQRVPDHQRLHVYVEDITEQEKAKQELRYLAFHDTITDLPNRHQMVLDLELFTQQKQTGYFALIHILGLDKVSASQGQQQVDTLLSQVCNRLHKYNQGHQECKVDFYRLYGDDFGAVVYQETEANVVRFLEGLCSRLQVAFIIGDIEHHVRSRVGITGIQPSDSVNSLIARSQTALQFVGGDKQRTIVHQPAMTASLEKNLNIERDLRLALKKQEFFLEYQPQICLKNHTLVGLEALVRWRKSDGVVVPPFDFIPIAENSGLIVVLGEWVFRESCRQLKEWQQLGGLPSAMPAMGINLSPRQFRHSGFLSSVIHAIKETNVDPNLLDLEITESLLMDDVDRAVALMHQLKALGVKLSIDDFGTGYSSLSYLSRFPVDKLKVDRSFVNNIPGNQDDENLVDAIINMAHALDLTVITEGVENFDQVEWLADHGSDEIQGYYFSRPLAADQVIPFSQSLIEKRKTS